MKIDITTKELIESTKRKLTNQVLNRNQIDRQNSKNERRSTVLGLQRAISTGYENRRESIKK